MASYSATAIKHATLTANTADVVTLGADYNRAEVCNRGTAELYFRVDGTAPTVAGDECFYVPAGGALQVDVPTAGNTVVKVISVSAISYTVTGI